MIEKAPSMHAAEITLANRKRFRSLERRLQRMSQLCAMISISE